MTEQIKDEFTKRIAAANKTEMVVIVFDIAVCHLDDALEAHKKGDMQAYNYSIVRARDCVMNLINTLDMEQEISNSLLSVYTYINKNLILARMEKDTGKVLEARNMLSSLQEAFAEIAKLDNSPSVMETTEHVVAGMTYGKGVLNENVVNAGGRTFSV